MIFRRSATSLLLGVIFGAACVSAAAAPVYDFTGGPPASAIIDSGTYSSGPVQPAGSGNIESFVRISTNQATVQGYNTTANNVFDTGNTDTFNHEITVGEVGFIGTDASGNGGFMRFLLDINQIGNQPKSLLSLNDVQVFVSTVANQNVEAFTGAGLVDFGATSALVHWMDRTDDNTIELDFDLYPGSGSTDLTLDLSRALFDPAFAALGLSTDDAKNGAYIYLYSRFGDPNGNNDGYEEWAYRKGDGIPIGCIPSEENNFCQPQEEIPEPGMLALVGLGLAGVAAVSRRRRKI